MVGARDCGLDSGWFSAEPDSVLWRWWRRAENFGVLEKFANY